jgi:hypothetical protein
MRRSPLIALVFVALLAVSPIVAVVGTMPVAAAENATATPTATPAGTETPAPTPEPTPTSESDDGLGLEELKRDGPRHANAPPSVRMGDELMWWVVYWPASEPMADEGNDDKWQYLEPDTQVGRNSVWLRTILFDSNERVTVKVAYWEKVEREVTSGNTTTTVSRAENVSVKTHDVAMQRGWPMVEIPLRQDDRPSQVTMWVEDSSGEAIPGARWTFEHKSVATTRSIAIDSYGDYLARAALDFLLWIAVGAFVVGALGKKALDRAGRGPGYGYAPWVFFLTLATLIGGYLFYQSLAELIVVLPTVLALYLVGIFGIVVLETYQSNVSKALFVQPRLEHSTAPDGSDAWDYQAARLSEQTTVDMPDGGTAIVTNGVLAFLARVFGSAAYLDFTGVETRVRTKGSKHDELFYVHPAAEDVVTYDAEGWEFNLPPLDKAHAGTYLLGAAAIGLAVLSVYAGLAGALPMGLTLAAGLVWITAEAKDGHAAVEWAPRHVRSAEATVLVEAEEFSDADTIRDAKDELVKARVSTYQQVEEELERHDGTLVEELVGADASPTIRDRERGGEDAVRENRRPTHELAENGAERGGDDDAE